MANLGLEAQLWMDVEKMEDRLKFTDRSNIGRQYAMLFIWKKLEAIAAKKYKELIQKLISDGQLVDPNQLTIAGNHVLGEGGKYIVQVNVSVPRREFNADWLAAELGKRYNVPVAITRQLIEEAKRPGDTQVRRISTMERGDN